MKTDLVRCYYTNGNSRAPAVAIRKLKLERIKHPCSCSDLTKLIAKLEETGSVLNEWQAVLQSEVNWLQVTKEMKCAGLHLHALQNAMNRSTENDC